MKQIFVAATRQNDGKTLVSLGLLRAAQRRGLRVGYMKPVGQSYRVVDGQKIDKDVVLMQGVTGLADAMSDMSPIAVPRGFTEAYIDRPDRAALAASVTAGYARVATARTSSSSRARVTPAWAVFDMSNADVARLLGARVVIVSQGGIGKPIDEIMMNKAKFDVMGVEVVGVIVNKVDPGRYDRIRPLVTRGLERLGLPCSACCRSTRRWRGPRWPRCGTSSTESCSSVRRGWSGPCRASWSGTDRRRAFPRGARDPAGQP
jgi:BioD-like phosphotransacetylase family protein